MTLPTGQVEESIKNRSDVIVYISVAFTAALPFTGRCACPEMLNDILRCIPLA